MFLTSLHFSAHRYTKRREKLHQLTRPKQKKKKAHEQAGRYVDNIQETWQVHWPRILIIIPSETHVSEKIFEFSYQYNDHVV